MLLEELPPGLPLLLLASAEGGGSGGEGCWAELVEAEPMLADLFG